MHHGLVDLGRLGGDGWGLQLATVGLGRLALILGGALATLLTCKWQGVEGLGREMELILANLHTSPTVGGLLAAPAPKRSKQH